MQALSTPLFSAGYFAYKVHSLYKVILRYRSKLCTYKVDSIESYCIYFAVVSKLLQLPPVVAMFLRELELWSGLLGNVS